MNEKPKQEEICGWFFLTSDVNQVHGSQGFIEQTASEYGHYICIGFSFLHGGETGRYVVSFDEISKYFTLTGKNSKDHSNFCLKNKIIENKPYKLGYGPIEIPEVKP